MLYQRVDDAILRERLSVIFLVWHKLGQGHDWKGQTSLDLISLKSMPPKELRISFRTSRLGVSGSESSTPNSPIAKLACETTPHPCLAQFSIIKYTIFLNRAYIAKQGPKLDKEKKSSSWDFTGGAVSAKFDKGVKRFQRQVMISTFDNYPNLKSVLVISCEVLQASLLRGKMIV